ncbi:hypothetical protein [Azotobacter beijerinckii]|uniref:hypothetical protein n=1 Tax=Azotobacter beijerinckii TaxID=170623 RepID=UPI001428C40E|nr:hypothetical protein [Azotobacter beijerinckii]
MKKSLMLVVALSLACGEAGSQPQSLSAFGRSLPVEIARKRTGWGILFPPMDAP